MTAPITTRSRGFESLLLLGIVLVLVLLVWWFESRGAFRDRAAEGRTEHMLTRPLRLEANGPAATAELLEWLRTFHYRANVMGEAVYRDRFIDTADGRLAAEGYSYRFRERVAGSDGAPWSVRLERSGRFSAEGERRLDVRSRLPEDLGAAIAGGAWDRAVTGGEGLPAPDRLRAVLAELGIDAGDLAPRLIGNLSRTRYELTDKGRGWFELDREDWTFREPGGDRAVSFTDVVIDTLLEKGDPEIERRVNTMDGLVTMTFAFETTDRAPAERARSRLR